MATLDNVQKVLGELGQVSGIGELSLDDRGACSLQVNDRLVVGFQYDEAEERLMLESEVGQVPAERAQSVLEMVAHGNRLGVDTNGGTLALGPEDEIILLRELPHAKLDLQTLGFALDEHVEALTRWVSRLSGSTTSTEDSGRPEAGMIDPSKLA